MARESSMRARVINALRTLHAVAVENALGLGTPDVNCSTGWIELKSEDAWPKRDETPLRLKRFTPHQKIWLKRRDAVGRAWLLLRVGREWLLFRGRDADIVGQSTRKQLFAAAARYWLNTPPDSDLLAVFKDDQPSAQP